MEITSEKNTQDVDYDGYISVCITKLKGLCVKRSSLHSLYVVVKAFEHIWVDVG